MTDLTPEQIERIYAILGSKKLYSRAAVEVKAPSVYGFIVRFNGFETFVGYSEAKGRDEAEDFALSEKLQSWYLNANDFEAGITQTSVVEVTHDQYCDWLRSKS